MRCSGPLDAGRTPVLLVHGTFTDADVWAPGYGRALPRAGHPTCTVTLPRQLLGDVQESVEYVVHAIRTVSARAGRPIAVIGHSQGAFLPTLALRLWPDLAQDVQDFIGLAGVYDNGTQIAAGICAVPCAAIARQLDPASHLLAGYRARPLYAGPGYTAIATDFDELVAPQPRAGMLGGQRRIAVQDLCPLRPVEHGALIGDAVAYALAIDAIEHPGPADPARVGDRLCGQVLLPGADAAGFAVQIARLAVPFTKLVLDPVPAEPALRCALDGACAKPRLRPVVRSTTTPRRDRRRPWVFATSGRVEQPANAIDQCAGSVKVLIKRGRRAVSRRTVPVGVDCRFSSAVTLGRSRRAGRRVRGKLRVSVSYAGAGELLPAAAPAVRVSAR